MKSRSEIADVYALLNGVATGQIPSELSPAARGQLRMMALGLAWVIDEESAGDMFAVTVRQLRAEMHRAGLGIGEAACACSMEVVRG